MSEFQSIAVGYDGSRESEAAVRWGAHLASVTQATLTVIHASGLIERLQSPFSSDAPPRTIKEIAAEFGLEGDRCRWLISDGDACSALLRCVDDPIKADVLVVGSRGEGKRVGMMIGSTSLELVQHSTTPVVVVPAVYVERQ